MQFSSDEENLTVLNTHLQKISQTGVKKYVVSIDARFIPLLDSMSVDERNDAINDIIAEYSERVTEKKLLKKTYKVIMFIILGLFLLLFTAPAVLWMVNKSFDMTKNNYSEMQNNFEVLYKNKKGIPPINQPTKVK